MLGKKIFIIPMTEELYDEINELMNSEDVGKLKYMSKNIENKILTIIGTSCIGYVEAEYFGGQGGQSGIIWQDGRLYQPYDFGSNAINSVLKHLGIIAQKGLDEFDTINMGRHRNNEDWLTSN